MVTVTQEGLEKFIELLQSLINLMVSGPIPAVYCMRLSHTITCPFSNFVHFYPNFQIEKVKGLVSNASLQCINNSQILNPHVIFQYCKKKKKKKKIKVLNSFLSERMS